MRISCTHKHVYNWLYAASQPRLVMMAPMLFCCITAKLQAAMSMHLTASCYQLRVVFLRCSSDVHTLQLMAAAVSFVDVSLLHRLTGTPRLHRLKVVQQKCLFV